MNDQFDFKYNNKSYTVDFIAECFKDEGNELVTQIEDYTLYLINDDLTTTLLYDISKGLDNLVCRKIAAFLKGEENE